MSACKDSIPFCAMEAVIDRFERIIKRLWVIIIILIVLLAGTNVAWILYESQFEEVTTVTTQEVDQDIDSGDGDLNVIGIGDMYGESETEN